MLKQALLHMKGVEMAIGVWGAIFDQPPLSEQNGIDGFALSFASGQCDLQLVMKRGKIKHNVTCKSILAI